MRSRVALGALLVLVLTGFGFLAQAARAADSPGAVYTLTNSPLGNQVLAFARAADGTLSPAGSFAAGGAGSGAGLGSQGAVVLSDNGRLLFAVNAGSNSVSSFLVRPGGLTLVDTAPSGGSLPTSVTYAHGLLYVLNAGTPNSISGIAVSPKGELEPIAGSTRPLSAAQTGPAQVSFDPSGSVLAVTEKATNRIDTYTIAPDGTPAGPAVYASAGLTPFGFAFDKRGHLIVSDAAGQSGASSYDVDASGVVTTIMAITPTGQRAACWTVVTKNGKYAYTTNAATGNISGFAIAHDGSLTLLDPSGINAAPGGNPTDAALSVDSRFLYARNAALGTIDGFRIASDGSLASVPGGISLPAGTVGLAAR
jgi:6-phosphogluconolactonase